MMVCTCSEDGRDPYCARHRREAQLEVPRACLLCNRRGTHVQLESNGLDRIIVCEWHVLPDRPVITTLALPAVRRTVSEESE